MIIKICFQSSSNIYIITIEELNFINFDLVTPKSTSGLTCQCNLHFLNFINLDGIIITNIIMN